MKSDILAVPTNTYAIKAKKALLKQNIAANVIKIDAFEQKVGCSYGIEFPSSEFYNAIAIMKGLNIPYKHLKKD